MLWLILMMLIDMKIYLSKQMNLKEKEANSTVRVSWKDLP